MEFDVEYDEQGVADDEREEPSTIRLMLKRAIKIQAFYSDQPIRFVEITDSIN